MLIPSRLPQALQLPALGYLCFDHNLRLGVGHPLAFDLAGFSGTNQADEFHGSILPPAADGAVKTSRLHKRFDASCTYRRWSPLRVIQLPRSNPAGLLTLEIQHAAQTTIDLVEKAVRYLPGVVVQIRFIECYQRCDVDDRVARKTCCCRRQEHVAGHGRQRGVRGNDRDLHPCQTALVVGIRLDDKNGPPFRWATARG
jgi:hypothetical protein